MRRAALARDWTRGSITGNLWSLTWPIIITQGVLQLGPLVDMIWVGKLGVAPIAGVGVAVLVVQLVNTIPTAFGTGTRALLARFIGAHDAQGANHVAQQAFVVSAGFFLVVATTGIFLAESILTLFGLEAEVIAQGTAYLRLMFIGSAAKSFLVMTESIMQASGDTVIPMRIGIFVRLVHLTIVPFLIFGWWLFPPLGVRGAALSNIAAESLGLAYALWVLLSGRTRLRLTLRNFRLDPRIIWRIVRIGIPAMFFTMQMNFSFLVLMRIVAPFGTLPVAAYSLYREVGAKLISLTNGAWGRGAGVMAAQNLGAGQPDRSQRSVWLALGFAEAYTVIAILAILLRAEGIVTIFTTNAALVGLASTFIRIATPGFLMWSLGVVMSGCLNDIGATLPVMMTMILGTWLAEMPLAFLLPRVTNLAAYGVIWGTVVGQSVRAVGYITYFKLGRWKRLKV